MERIKKGYQIIQKWCKTVPKIVLISCLFLFLALGKVGVTYGRYVYNEIRDYYLSTKSFYFNSDKLKRDVARYQIDNWSGVDPMDVTFNMNSMQNNKVSATSDISYEISYTCSDNVACQITKTEGIIYQTTHTDYFTVTITPDGTLKEGDVVTLYVEANATAPYKKTISGYFTLKIGIPGLAYEIVDKQNQPYFELNITNTLDYYKVITAFSSYQEGDKIDINTYLSLTETEKENCASAIINLDFDPTVVLLDMTNSAYLRAISKTTQIYNGYDYLKGISFKVDALSSEVVRFYKKNPKEDYTYPFGTEKSIVDVSYKI